MTGRSRAIAFARAVTAALLVLAMHWAVAASGADGAVQLKDLMGTYLGRAIVKDLDTNKTEEREIDVEISPFKGNGFHIRWVNVTLVGGRRDVPGVKRRLSAVAFTPVKGQTFFVEVPESSVFGEREELTPLGGDPVRWAVLDAAGLHLYAFVVLDDGRYELQTYSRRRTPQGIDLHYARVVDGRPVRIIEGRAVKAE
jgi:hypothetical protein